MTLAGEIGGKDLLYLDDLQVGQRFTSKTHRVDEAQIKAFASQFDPQPFHLDENAAKDSLFSGLVASGWHTAAMTMRLLVETDCRWPAVSSGPEGNSPGRGRPGRAISCASRARFRRSSPRARGRIVGSWRCAWSRAISATKRCRSSWPSSSCRAAPSSDRLTHNLRRRRYAMYSEGASIHRLKAGLA